MLDEELLCLRSKLEIVQAPKLMNKYEKSELENPTPITPTVVSFC